ncbi:MAG TPA: glycosyltransferase 87 family protein [Candidatus Tyrphobacter sp.]
MTANARAIVSALLWIACTAVFAEQVAGVVRVTGTPISGNDFPAFYCAGQAIAQHQDPYTVEPLRTCEHALPHGSDLPARYVTPAPLPPYALDVFALLAQLPYRLAAWLWFGLLTAACAWLAFTIARVTRLPSGAIACALLLSAALASALSGQIPPLAALAIALCGAALLSGDDALAAICAAGATIEPHVGLATALALFFFRPRTRGWLIGAGLAFAGLSILAVTPHGVLEYFASVLPAQARAELLSADQFSLSHVLARVGFADRVAMLGGSASYVAMLALGLAAARAAERRLDAAAIAYVPAAAALFGGVFVHEIQLVAALPAAFLVIARGSPAFAWFGRLLVAAVAAVPFTVAAEHRPIVDALALFCASGALVATVPFDEPIDFATALGAFVLSAACVALPLLAQRVTLPAPTSIAAPATLPRSNDAGDNWGAYLRSDPRYSALHPDAEVAKLPVWLGLGALILAAFGLGRSRQGPMTQPAWDPRPRIHVSP